MSIALVDLLSMFTKWSPRIIMYLSQIDYSGARFVSINTIFWDVTVM